LSRCRILIFALSLPAFAGSVDEHVYRGAQPTDDGFQYLSKIGIKTVIDLRETDERARAEERLVRAAGMQ
jgi:tyrosine-protein phosphatase SIW14